LVLGILGKFWFEILCHNIQSRGRARQLDEIRTRLDPLLPESSSTKHLPLIPSITHPFFAICLLTAISSFAVISPAPAKRCKSLL
jgi:hypothetical protein